VISSLLNNGSLSGANAWCDEYGSSIGNNNKSTFGKFAETLKISQPQEKE
jgi:hypothetical protein